MDVTKFVVVDDQGNGRLKLVQVIQDVTGGVSGGGGIDTVNGQLGPSVNLTAADIPATPFGSIAATDVQSALQEIVNEEGNIPSPPNGAAGGVLSGTYPNPGFAADMATQAELDAHSATTASVHGIADTSQLVTQSQQTTALAAKADLTLGKVPTTQIPSITAAMVAADVATQAELDAHTGQASGAHAATAISNTPAGNIAATTVQAALNELDTEKVATTDTSYAKVIERAATIANTTATTAVPDPATAGVTFFPYTLAVATTTFTFPTAAAGKSFTLKLVQDATGSRLVTWPTVKWGTAGAPTLSTAAGKIDLITFVSDGTNWFGTYALGF